MKTQKAIVHPSKVQRKASFRSWVELSVPSKIRAFLSPKTPHIRQWGIMFQITPSYPYVLPEAKPMQTSELVRGPSTHPPTPPTNMLPYFRSTTFHHKASFSHAYPYSPFPNTALLSSTIFLIPKLPLWLFHKLHSNALVDT